MFSGLWSKRGGDWTDDGVPGFYLLVLQHGKSYDKSINGSHSNISSKDKDQGVLTWAIERAAQVSKHFEGSISNPSSMLFSKL